MKIANMSSKGSMKKNVPPTPSQRYSTSGHDVFSGTDVRTAKPRPKQLVAPG
jgi:hypothetical protein